MDRHDERLLFWKPLPKSLIRLFAETGGFAADHNPEVMNKENVVMVGEPDGDASRRQSTIRRDDQPPTPLSISA